MLLEHRLRSRRGIRIIERATGPFGVQIVPFRSVSSNDVRSAVNRLPPTDRLIVTSALSSHEAKPFLECGFIEYEQLELLRYRLSERLAPAGVSAIRDARRADLEFVLDIDAVSFDDFWALDADGLQQARRATRHHRYVVATINDAVAGYCITGRGNTTAFLQRLAVHPDHRKLGVARDLVSDAVSWSREQRCDSMLVNTQQINRGALAAYEALGFKNEDQRLTVLEWPS